MTEPVTAADLRAHLRIDDTSEDGYLSGLVPAARRLCESNMRREVADLDADETAMVGQAIRLIVGHWYRNRETINIGNISSALPWAADALLDALRGYARS